MCDSPEIMSISVQEYDELSFFGKVDPNVCYFLTDDSSHYTNAYIDTPHIRPLNCPNCGAPTESDKCLYCGTNFLNNGRFH